MKRHFYLGVDVGGTYTKMALVDEKSCLKARHQISSRGFSDKALFKKSIRDGFHNILSEQGLSPARVKGIGIGLPGPVDSDRGIVLSLTNIKAWKNFPLVASLKDFFSTPVFIENDANCMALAESRLGAARGVSFALCVTLGTGVGGGLILNREIYHGPYFLGGEVGHIPVALHGPRCACGGQACLERYVGNRSLMHKIKSEFKKRLSLEEVSDLAKKGNHQAIKIWDEAGHYVGLALSGVVNVFNPEVIVIGGGVSLAGDILLRAIERSIKRHAMTLLKNEVKVRKALLGNDAGVLGAALLAKEKIEVGVCR